MNNQVLFITGSAGFIGSNLARRLLAEQPDAAVIGIDNMNDYYDVRIKEARLAQLQKYPNFTFIKADIADKAVVQVLFQIYQPDIVVNLAAQAGVREGARAGEEQLSELIARETGAYIVDKAAALGAERSARVTCGRTEEGLLLPVAAEVTGALTPAQREELARLMEEELGIPKENQTYQGGEDG